MTRTFASVAGAVAVSLTITVGAQQPQQAQTARPPQAPPAPPAQQESFDYWGPQREMIRRGQQAIMMCNGLFTSNRTLEQIYCAGVEVPARADRHCGVGDYVVDRARRTVAIGKAGSAPVMRAAFREGIGCVILAPDQTFDDIDKLPSLTLPHRPAIQQPRRGPMAISSSKRR